MEIATLPSPGVVWNLGFIVAVRGAAELFRERLLRIDKGEAHFGQVFVQISDVALTQSAPAAAQGAFALLEVLVGRCGLSGWGSISAVGHREYCGEMLVESREIFRRFAAGRHAIKTVQRRTLELRALTIERGQFFPECFFPASVFGPVFNLRADRLHLFQGLVSIVHALDCASLQVILFAQIVKRSCDARIHFEGERLRVTLSADRQLHRVGAWESPGTERSERSVVNDSGDRKLTLKGFRWSVV